jgi:hypothetical protein
MVSFKKLVRLLRHVFGDMGVPRGEGRVSGVAEFNFVRLLTFFVLKEMFLYLPSF